KGKDVFKTLKLVRQLNPHTRNLNMIYPGQELKLPVSPISTVNQEAELSGIEPSAGKENSREEKPDVTPANRLAIIGHVIKRMNGTIVTTGTHCIPLSQGGQTTIDCSKIPLVELDDGSVILLDFGNRIPEDLGKMIRASWKNYHLVKSAGDDDITHVIRKIISASRLYTINKMLKPLIIEGSPQIRLLFDWMIKKTTLQGEGTKPYLQGLSLVTESSLLLPGALITYAEKKGLIITEILDGNPVISKTDITYIPPVIPIISKTANNRELVWNLLTILGYLPAKDADVRIFDMVDGFNLALKADLIVQKGDKQVIIHTKRLPQQFINILKSKGTEIVFLEKGETKRSVVEEVLHAMDIPFSYQVFSFSIPEKNDRARAAITLPAIKTTTEDKHNLYLVEFDMDRGIYGLLHGERGVNILGY
ncbi:MAG: hypothetical protein Q7J12_07660, partial [Syntrophales bacterium]|nr:hypothetical protein [Syntrophales bacterium]